MTDNTQKRKFMFDQSFDHLNGDANGQDRANKPVLLKPEQIEAMKLEAHDQGFAAGHAVAAEEELARQSGMLATLEEQMTRVLQNMALIQESQNNEIRMVVTTIMAKILPGFVARNGTDEITAMLNTVIGEMMHEPRLVVRLHEMQFDSIKAKIDEIIAKKAYAGKVIVLADTEIAQGDCRVEWADGGIERNAATTTESINSIVNPPSAFSEE